MSNEPISADISHNSDVYAFTKNMNELMEKLEAIQNKIGPLEFGTVPQGLKGSLMKLFEACCPLSRSQSDEALFQEHENIRGLLHDPYIPKGSNINAVFADIDRKTAIQELIEYVESNGGDASALQLRENGNGDGFNVYTNRFVESHEPFISVPKSLVMDSEVFKNHPTLECLAYNDPILSSMKNVLLTCALLFEFYKGSEGQYWPYIRTLPHIFHNACYFDLEEMRSLQNSVSMRDALNIWKGLVRQYSYFHLKILEAIESNVPSISNSVITLKLIDKFCFEDYRWASAAIMSRSISLSLTASNVHSLSLIPLVDLCDHGDVISSVNYDAQSGMVTLNSGRHVEKNNHFALFYGTRTNSQFLFTYGFLPEYNHHDFVLIRIPLDKDSQLYESKHSLLKRLGMSEFLGLPIGIKPQNKWSGDLMAYMRLWAATSADLTALVSQDVDSLRQRLLDPLPISESNETLAFSELTKKLSHILEKYKECESPKVEFLNDPTINQRSKLIVKLKRSEYKIIDKVYRELSANNPTSFRS